MDSLELLPAEPGTTGLGRLCITGTQPGSWRVWADGLAVDLRPGRPVEVHAPSTLDGADADRWLIFIEGPERAVGARAGAAEAALAEWAADARRLLIHAQNAPRRTLVIDVAEAIAEPAAMAAALEGWLGQPVAPATAHLAASALDPVMSVLAAQLCAGDAGIGRLWDELQAVSTPLLGDARIMPVQQASPAEALAAHMRTIDLVQEVSELRRTLDSLRAERDEAIRHGNGQGQALDVARAEAQFLVGQLQAAHDDFAVLVRSTEVERSQHDARLADAEARTAAARSQAEARVADAEARAATARREAQEAQARLAARPKGTEAELRRAIEEREQIAAELVRVLAQGVPGSPGLPPPGQMPDFSFAELGTLEHAENAGPHRELRFRFEQSTLGAQVLAVARLKLVEHLGRPGLVLLSRDGEQRAVSQWHADGAENGESFMLLIPGDDQGRHRLETLGAADWAAVLDAARLLDRAVAAHDGLDARWPVVAGRLLAQLQAMPARLRYDQRRTEPAGNAGHEACVVLQGVMFGVRPLPDVRLCWHPGQQAGELTWELQDDAQTAPPVADWPVDDHGRLARAWPLVLGAGTTWRQRARWWQGLGPEVRALLLGLLDVLPEQARHLREQAHRAMRAGRATAALRARLGRR